MNRRSRVLLLAAALGSAAIVIVLLTYASSASEGPLAGVLERAGAAIGSIEERARERFSGPGRRGELSWFSTLRAAPGVARPGVVLLGVFDDRFPQTFDGVSTLERSLGTTFPLVHLYTAWGDKPDERFPVRAATTIWDIGSVPVITWEPWLTDFENTRHAGLALREARERHGLAAVAHGDYDFYVDAWAADAARFGRPIFVRFAHEMNDPYRYPWGPQNNTIDEFIAAWRHVVDRFRQAGAGNVIWVWSPHVAYPGWERYYPGGGYADWVATGVLNYGPIAQWSQWWTFQDIFGAKYERLASFGKPIMIAEFGSLAVGGDRSAWYREALTNLPSRFPAVRSVIFFNAASDQTVTQQQVDWSIAGTPEVTRAVADAIRGWDPRRKPAGNK